MRARLQHSPIAHDRPGIRRAYTLAELAASMAIMVILMGAMTSTILIASHAIPNSEDPAQKKLAAMDIVDQIAGELFYATSITEELANAVTFTVADRGHGAAGPETIRYEWSGTPGDPLTREYNGGTVVKVCEEVQLFKLAYTKRGGQVEGPPSVLLMVDDDAAPTAEDEARRQMIESWGFTLQVLSDHRTLAEQEVALQSADVVFLAQGAHVPAFLGLNPAVGIVCEERALYADVGIAKSSGRVWGRTMNIVDNTHEITKPFPLGNLCIFSVEEYLALLSWQMTPDGTVLGHNESDTDPVMVAIDVGGELYGGGTAPARRVSLPWGDDGWFEFKDLNSDGLTLMRRAIVWAAAPVVYSGVRIVLKPPEDNERLRTEVQVFNMPKVSIP